ncbi:MAG: hypothetical protein KC492_37975 [Myxococcales bacterium]|nr:hypothetical protein [Myxococcales bacterium]
MPLRVKCSDGKWYGTAASTVKEAIEQAEAKGLSVIGTVRLPYPCDPRLDPDNPIPSLCWQPDGCMGRTSCPRPICCTN